MPRTIVSLKVARLEDFARRFGAGFSAEGFFLPTPSMLPLETPVLLRLVGPDGAVLFEAEAIVESARPKAADAANPAGLRLGFVELSTPNRAFLELALASLREPQSEPEEVSLDELGFDEAFIETEHSPPPLAAFVEIQAPVSAADDRRAAPIPAPAPLAEEPPPVMAVVPPPPPEAPPAPPPEEVVASPLPAPIPEAPAPPAASPPAETAPRPPSNPSRRAPPSALIVGIDLGTTFSCAAIVRDGRAVVIPSSSGHRTIPSVVTVTDDVEEVGWAALDKITTFPDRTIYGSKRLLGCAFASPAVQEARNYFDYEIVDDGEGKTAVRIAGKIYSLTWVSSRILEEMRTWVCASTGENVTKAVITVPAWYHDRQRTEVVEAARLAGLEVLQIVNEPTAAAIAYGLDRGLQQKVLVYDFGGGTFDVSILDIQGNVIDVLATGGDAYLGGIDLDNRLLDWALGELERKTGIDLSEDKIARLRVREAAENAKRELSAQMETRIHVPFLARQGDTPLTLDVTLTRDKLNRLVIDLVDRSIEICRRTLAEARLTVAEIDEVVFVGGQTRMPLIQGKVHALTGKQPRKGVHPDEAVALGAAQLGWSRDKIDSVTLIDVVSLPIGVGLPGGRFKAVIDRNSKLPAVKEFTRATTRDDQTSITVDVFQGEQERVDQNEFLGTAKLDGLPPLPKGQVSVRLHFRVDAQGFLTVTSTEAATGLSRKVTLVTRDTPETAKEARAAAPAPEASAAPEKVPKRGLFRRFFGR